MYSDVLNFIYTETNIYKVNQINSHYVYIHTTYIHILED